MSDRSDSPARRDGSAPFSPEADIAGTVSARARLSQRLARFIPTSPAVLRPETALVSFTFDDTPACSCTTGGAILAAHEARATFYVSGGLIGTRRRFWRHADDAELADVHAAGHELGSHTHAHVFVPGLSEAEIAEESRRNRERLRTIAPDIALRSFAFPFGFGSLSAKRALGRIYATSRSIAPGINAGLSDLHYLRANPLIEGKTDAGTIARLMDEALRRKGWLIFYGHDVVRDPSPYGCTPTLLGTAVRAAAARGIPRVTVSEGLRRAVR